MFKYFSALVILFIGGCGDEKISTEPVTQINTVQNEAKNTFDTSNHILDVNGCYEMVLRQDTASMELHMKDSVVTGNLVFDWNEKDGNTGTIKGIMKGNLIYADYVFESEGMTSVREVIFKLEGSLLQQGVGDLDEQNNKIVYRNKTSLDFNVMPPFMKVDCNHKQ
jgi:hypothetical protein